MKIITGLKAIKPFSDKKPSASAEKQIDCKNRGMEEPQKRYSPQKLSSAVLANATYKSPEEQVKEFKSIIKSQEISLPDDFYEKLDTENIREHLNHLKFLVNNNSDMGYGSIFRNGYFYSKDGAKAFDILMKNYSAIPSTKYRDAFSIMLVYSPEQILKAEERGLFDNRIKTTNDTDFDNIYEMIKLSDDEFDRLEKSGLRKEGILYASENDDINKMFLTLKKDKKTTWDQNDYKKLDKIISALDDKDKIKEITGKITNLKHKDILNDVIDKSSKEIDISTVVDNLDNIYEMLHKHIEDFDDNDFFNSSRKIIASINKDNLETVKKLIKIKGMNQDLLMNVIRYMYNKENIGRINTITDEINKGNESLIALPPYKYAQINTRVSNAKNEVLDEYDKNTPLSKLEKESHPGDIFFYGNDVYIKGEDKLEKLDIDKATYKKLFPKYESLCIQQGEETADCYFLTAGPVSLWKNPKGRVLLLKMFKQDKNDIIVTIPGLSDYPVRFKGGNIKLLKKHATTSLGNLMFEQAYAKARYTKEKGITGNASAVNPDLAMEYIGEGFESHAMNDLTGSHNAMEYINKKYEYYQDKPEKYEYVTKEEMFKKFDEFSDLNKYIVCLGSGIREGGNLPEYGITPHHSYAVEKIDTENKTITIVNPRNTLYGATITYDQANDYFSGLSVIEM